MTFFEPKQNCVVVTAAKSCRMDAVGGYCQSNSKMAERRPSLRTWRPDHLEITFRTRSTALDPLFYLLRELAVEDSLCALTIDSI